MSDSISKLQPVFQVRSSTAECVKAEKYDGVVSELHVRNSLISLHDLVAHLHHQLKRKVGFFDGDHGAVQVRAFSVKQLGNLAGGIALRALDLIHRLLQDFEKFASHGAPGGCGTHIDRQNAD
jgi:hypothetical protein